MRRRDFARLSWWVLTFGLAAGCAHGSSGSAASAPSATSGGEESSGGYPAGAFAGGQPTSGYSPGAFAPGQPASAPEPVAMMEMSVAESRSPSRRERRRERDADAMAANARPSPQREQAGGPPSPPAAAQPAPEVATDAVDLHGPMLVYTGTFHLAVYEIARTQETLKELARSVGGFVASSTDDSLVVRVPARRFDETVAALEQAGQVEHRDVKAEDVGEEFRDVTIRIRNLEAMRNRVEALLASASTVADALAIEQQLSRITDELERLKGRERYLADRVSFATITVWFRRRSADTVAQDDLPRLPFPWLESLGLRYLLPN